MISNNWRQIFMRAQKSCIIIVMFVLLMLLSINAMAINDDTGDLYHYIYSDNKWSWEAYSGEKDQIDITDISYSMEGSQVTLTMTCADTIAVNDKIALTMYLQSDDDSSYLVMYVSSSDMGTVLGQGDYQGFYELLENPVTGNIFTATFEVSNPDADYEVWGFSAEYLDIGDQGGEAWWDYAPDSNAPWYIPGDNNNNNNNNDGTTTNEKDDGTPGFEAIILLAAVAVALILIKRRR